jgi:hypothetical protein
MFSDHAHRRLHLAQVNAARACGQPNEPVMAEFMTALPEINALAERSPGFVWRLQTGTGTRPRSGPAATR